MLGTPNAIFQRYLIFLLLFICAYKAWVISPLPKTFKSLRAKYGKIS
jgi:hypothetical protein